MADVLFINIGPEGHVNPSLPIVKTLVDMGENVTAYVGDGYEDKFKATGANINTLSSETMLETFLSERRENLFSVINGLVKMYTLALPKILANIEGKTFDYIVADSMFSGAYAMAQKLQLPLISLVSSFAETEADFDDKIKLISKTVPVADKTYEDERFNELIGELNNAMGLELSKRYEIMNNPGNMHISAVLKGFQFENHAYHDDAFTFIGPRTSEANQDDTFMDDIDQSKPIIYISLGTVFNENMAFFNQCIEALKDLDVTVIMSIGNTNDVADFEHLSDQFIVRNYVPQKAILKQADVFMTHAGMNSTNEAIMAHVPMLAFPQSADQPFVSKQLEDLGLGVKLNSSTVTVDDIKSHVNAILEEKAQYQQALEQVSATHCDLEVVKETIRNFKQAQKIKQ
ncbi:macrolide family glycosyltransferase [Staphylococcus massiliensis]|uniref:macrolide family glycosyltransferase n=1 Tax=Staphylococcus massiliensis TaxID=555791 RepID=UPI001EE0DB71|nr:macrolide family glycosyltransferase [Staphylococcus massiliensis]MCG3399203.1 glycosyl transferase [Staphylococcus massiliensis]